MGLDGLDFGFLWIGILDSDGVWAGFGLVGWVGVVGNGGGVVGSGLFGCFCYGFARFLVGFILVFFFLFWVLVPVGLVSRGQWWVVGCLVVFAMGLLGLWWVFDGFFFFLGFWFRWVWWAEGSDGVVVIFCLVVEKVRGRQGQK